MEATGAAASDILFVGDGWTDFKTCKVRFRVEMSVRSAAATAVEPVSAIRIGTGQGLSFRVYSRDVRLASC